MLVSVDTEREGGLCITKQQKIAGVISGANGIKPGMLMGSKGLHCVWQISRCISRKRIRTYK